MIQHSWYVAVLKTILTENHAGNANTGINTLKPGKYLRLPTANEAIQMNNENKSLSTTRNITEQN